MRKIKFRGKRKDNKEWLFGHYYYDGLDNRHFIDNVRNSPQCPETGFSDLIQEWVEVIPETVGQYTGLKDKNGNEIYEGDITKDKYVIMFHKQKALFAEHFYSTFQDTWNLSSYPISSQGIEVIGNIHENPELLN